LELTNNSGNTQETTLPAFLHPVILSGMIIEGNIFLAPMAGYTDAAFRSICLDNGAFFTYTEMVSAEALFRRNENTLTLLERAENERLLGVQFFTSNPHVTVPAVHEIIKYNPSLIDLNCGCSIPKILKSGSGAALLKKPPIIKEIIHIVKNETDIPVSLKIRSGWDSGSLNFLQIGSMAEKEGASLITIHPRTAVEMFKAKARWQHIAKLKKECSIPVIGSGDLFSADDAYHMLTTTGCDGVMIARGAVGNPFIFKQIKNLLTKGSYKNDYTAEEKLGCALEHLRRTIQIKGEKKACTEMRKHFCAYTRGLPNSSDIRKRCVLAESQAEYEEIVREYCEGSLKK
jgi:tRNA-dihydrouridine synthase B